MFTRRERQAERPGPFWKQRSWQTSAGFLAVVLAMAGIVALTSEDDTAEAGGSSASSGPLSGTSTAQGGRPAGCRTDDSAGDAQPTAVPTDVEWRRLGVTRVPVSASLGPTQERGPVLWCFAHTPTGAALAAHIIPSQMSGSNWRTVTEQQVLAGHGRDLFVSQRSTVEDVDTPSAGTTASYAGYSVTTYENDTATVDLLINSGQSSYSATTIALRWDKGDWKVVPGNDGSLHTPVNTVPGTGGFLIWGN